MLKVRRDKGDLARSNFVRMNSLYVKNFEMLFESEKNVWPL